MSTQPTQPTLYDDLGGFDVLLAICVRWHELCVADPLAAHPFERPLHHRHDERLAAYLAEATGGPPLYTAGYGDQYRVSRLHAGNGPAHELVGRCCDLFDVALRELDLAPAPAERLSAYFRAATDRLEAYPESAADVPRTVPFDYVTD